MCAMVPVPVLSNAEDIYLMKEGLIIIIFSHVPGKF